MLLLHGWDPVRPGDPFWFTIGGAVEPGETLREAAVRELREEAGITVDPALLGEPIETAPIEFWWGGFHFLQDQTFYAIALAGRRGQLRGPGGTGTGDDRQARVAVSRGSGQGRRAAGRPGAAAADAAGGRLGPRVGISGTCSAFN